MTYPMTAAAIALSALVTLSIIGCAQAQTQTPSTSGGSPTTLRVADIRPVLPMPPGSSNAFIFADDFDKQPDFRTRYFEYGDSDGSFVWDARAGLGGTGAMRCRFDKGQVTAGNLKVVFGKNPFRRGYRQEETFREIYWRVYVRHEPGWQGNPAKLARATVMAGADWSQGLIAHVWGGKGDVLCIDPASGIAPDGRKVSVRYNDFEHLRWLGLRNAQTPIFSPAESGRWVCVESRVRINTPGQKDGVFELWVDGRKEASRADLDWHGAWDEYGINAVFLENYWNEGSVKRQSRWFDGFIISTRPIGPVRTSTTPMLTLTAAASDTLRQVQVAADPQGSDIVWTLRTTPHRTNSRITVNTADGVFQGSHQGKTALASGNTYWVRTRNTPEADWSPWHIPFQTAAAAAAGETR